MGILSIFGKQEEKPTADFPMSVGQFDHLSRAGCADRRARQASRRPDLCCGRWETSLSKIAKRYYGDASQWHRIHRANRDRIKNPDLIHRVKLTIPGA